MFFTVIDREAPYKVIAKPLEGRIHLGRDNDEPSPAVSSAAAAQPEEAAARAGSQEGP
jgi:hypothetical protein